MSDFIFRISPNIVLGPYTISRISQYVKEWGSRFIVIMDPILKEVGEAEKILKPLDEKKIDYFVFSEFSDRSDTKTIERILSLARDSHVHGIIAAGGTKVLDTGCAIASLYNESQSMYDFVDGSVPTTSPLPLICVPTTLRSPFIYTPFTPVLDARSHQAKLLKIKQGVCRLSVIDPNMTLTLSESQMNAMTIETMCLAFEAYLSQRASFFSDMFVEKAITLLHNANEGEVSLDSATPPVVLRSQAGFMASLAAATSAPGAATLLALCMNARLSVSRSLVSAILFPHIVEDALTFKSDRLISLAKLLDITSDEPTECTSLLANYIRQTLAKANLPMRLKDLSVSIEQLALIADDAGSLELMTSLPRSMTSDDLFELLKKAF
ncbi:MAG: iron-containing alcohol dehydrogenase [Treponema sp.]|nr:iron-containing alcohol dehydrogenase [Treponema sp.]